MTLDDIGRIQSELNLTLPRRYVDIVRAYPFPDDSWLHEVLVEDPNWLIRTNHEWRETSWPNENWKEHHYVIGSDGGECCFYIDTRQEDSPVYTVSLEDHVYGLIEDTPSLGDFVAKWLLDYEAGLEKEKQRQAQTLRKRWRHFWE